MVALAEQIAGVDSAVITAWDTVINSDRNASDVVAALTSVVVAGGNFLAERDNDKSYAIY